MGEFRQGLRENFRGSFPYYIGFGQETSFEITVDIPIDAVYNISFFIPNNMFTAVHSYYQNMSGTLDATRNPNELSFLEIEKGSAPSTETAIQLIAHSDLLLLLKTAPDAVLTILLNNASKLTHKEDHFRPATMRQIFHAKIRQSELILMPVSPNFVPGRLGTFICQTIVVVTETHGLH